MAPRLLRRDRQLSIDDLDIKFKYLICIRVPNLVMVAIQVRVKKPEMLCALQFARTYRFDLIAIQFS